VHDGEISVGLGITLFRYIRRSVLIHPQIFSILRDGDVKNEVSQNSHDVMAITSAHRYGTCYKRSLYRPKSLDKFDSEIFNR
jgi:hypothetical protein